MMKNRKKRFREQQQFWLNLNKPEEAMLSEQIAQLKANREFVSTVRQGIALVMALRQGNLSLLDEMFPQAVDEIFQTGVESVSTKVDANGVEEKLTELTTMVKDLSLSPIADPTPKPLLASGNLKALTSSSQPLSGQDDHDNLDDLLDIKDISPTTDNPIGQNLINSMLRSKTIKSDKPTKPSKVVKKERQSLEDLIEIREGK